MSRRSSERAPLSGSVYCTRRRSSCSCPLVFNVFSQWPPRYARRRRGGGVEVRSREHLAALLGMSRRWRRATGLALKHDKCSNIVGAGEQRRFLSAPHGAHGTSRRNLPRGSPAGRAPPCLRRRGRGGVASACRRSPRGGVPGVGSSSQRSHSPEQLRSPHCSCYPGGISRVGAALTQCRMRRRIL